VPEITTPACPCGWRRQTPEHILLACPLYEEGRPDLWLSSGTDSYNDLLQDKNRLKLITRWFIQARILKQFNFTQEIEQEAEQETEINAINELIAA
jgi:hypothetical protein